MDDAVWFVAGSPAGPWDVATEIPEEIYTIPPSSPVYYATFVRIYQFTDDEVEVGYTPGYQGNYENDGTVVYGTGWDYESWYNTVYYGWGWTWGYGYIYVPWYQWWVWHPPWSPPGGLRGAIIENIYDRWTGRPGVIHHDRDAGSAATRAYAGSGGHPVLYGRYWPSWPSWPTTPSWPTEPSATLHRLPASTLALNLYTRPEAPIRPGEVPKGAQLLSTLSQNPGGGRDLYASPEGGVYMRRTDGWYRHQAGGGWRFYAPTQGTIQRSQAAPARRAQASGASSVYRPVPGPSATRGRAQGFADRMPNHGSEVRAQDVAALERQYYARSLAQARAQTWRAHGNVSRPPRGTVRRR